MKLSVVNIEHQGDREKEVVTLAVNEDCDLRHFIVASATFNREDVKSNLFRDTLWLPSVKAKKGDYILLFTRDGENADRENNLGSTSHLIFWGSEQAVWHEKDDEIMLFELNAWDIQKTRTFVSLV